MIVLAHLLDTPVYSFQGDIGYWLSCFPHGIDRRLPVNVRCLINVHHFKKQSLQGGDCCEKKAYILK